MPTEYVDVLIRYGLQLNREDGGFLTLLVRRIIMCLHGAQRLFIQSINSGNLDQVNFDRSLTTVDHLLAIAQAVKRRGGRAIIDNKYEGYMVELEHKVHPVIDDLVATVISNIQRLLRGSLLSLRDICLNELHANRVDLSYLPPMIIYRSDT